MSRTNPDKKKRRAASQTLLMYGEGLGEEIFLKYLRSLYARDSGVAVTIRKGKGGNAVSIIIDATNTPGAFDKRVVIMDNDRGEQEMTRAREAARQRGVELLENSPCLEAILLSTLNNGQSYPNKNSDWCKSEFESKYLDKKKRTEINEYGKIFPKNMLDEQRRKVRDLNRLVLLMEGDNS